MSVTQYVGARYVPLFANPIDWDITKAYEPLTIVYYQGNSYTSKQSVPTNTDINNSTYWALTGNYNAQIEQYRSEVVAAKTGADTANATNTTQDAQIAGTTDSGLKTLINTENTTNTTQDAQLAGTTDSGLKTLITNESTARGNKDTALDAQLAGTTDSGLKTLITNETTARGTKDTALDAQLAGTTDSGLKNLITSEASARSSKDTSIDAQLAGTTDSGLKTLITNETNARTTRENLLGTSANKNFDTTVTAGSDNLITASGVFNFSAFRRNKKVIVIGDSYVHSDNGRTALDQTMGSASPDWDIRFSSDSGSAFTFPGALGYTFKQLLDNSRTMFPDATKVDYVILIGGRNEAGAQGSEHMPSSTLAAAADTFYSRAVSYFPNAKIVTFMPYDWKLPNSNILEVGRILREESFKNGCTYAEYCWSWGVGREGTLYIGGTGIHPNAAGSAYMSKLIYEAVEYNNFDCFVGRYDTYSSTNFILHREGITIAGMETTSGSSNQLIALSNFPTWLQYRATNVEWRFPAYNVTKNDDQMIAVSISQYGLSVCGGTVYAASKISFNVIAPLNIGL